MGYDFEKYRKIAQGIIDGKSKDTEQYYVLISKNREAIEAALQTGNRSLAEKLATGIVKYRVKIDRLQREIGNVEASLNYADNNRNEIEKAEISESYSSLTQALAAAQETPKVSEAEVNSVLEEIRAEVEAEKRKEKVKNGAKS